MENAEICNAQFLNLTHASRLYADLSDGLIEPKHPSVLLQKHTCNYTTPKIPPFTCNPNSTITINTSLSTPGKWIWSTTSHYIPYYYHPSVFLYLQCSFFPSGFQYIFCTHFWSLPHNLCAIFPFSSAVGFQIPTHSQYSVISMRHQFLNSYIKVLFGVVCPFRS